jgi:uncharacterized protein
MPPSLTSITDDVLIAADNIADLATGLINPTLRLGVTGLSRSGKTVFITSLVHNLLNGGRLPLLRAVHQGRVSAVQLDAQPDDAVPRFQYEDHIRDMLEKRIWPDSTRSISELRLTINYESASGWNRLFKPGKLSLDIVDYPGEWLLDLPLLAQDYAQFTKNALQLSKTDIRAPLASQWLSLASHLDPSAPADEMAVRGLANAYAAYLKACKEDKRSLSMLPPGRFLMPGDLEGSPALTFAPLARLVDGPAPKGSVQATMERRFESYKAIVVKPFFREHFARLDRQIVLVDTLQAINRGPEALQDLQHALGDVLECFRAGKTGLISSLLTRRIDKVLIAATKADHLHHESHDRLEAVTRRLVSDALKRIGMSGAGIDTMALAAVRATREATIRHDGQDLPVITGTPMEGEVINGERFDGKRKTAIFPGDLPEKPDTLFQHSAASSKATRSPNNMEAEAGTGQISVVRFRPPELGAAPGLELTVPHIRLDRALEFLIGDRLQ